MVLGPAIGTFVFKQCGIYISIGIVSFAFLLQGLMLLFLPADRPIASNAAPNFWKEFKEGFSYVYHSPILRHLGIAFALGGFAVGAVQPLFIFIIVEKLHLPKEYIQWFTIVNGVAMIAGGALVIWISKHLSPQKILAIGNISCAAINVITGFSTQVFLIFVLQFMAGFILPFIMVGINTIVMKSSESSFVGRVNGVFSPIYIGSMLVMLSMSGWLKLHLSLEGMYVLSGALFVVATLVISRMFRLSFKPSSGQYGRDEVVPGSNSAAPAATKEAGTPKAEPVTLSIFGATTLTIDKALQDDDVIRELEKRTGVSLDFSSQVNVVDPKEKLDVLLAGNELPLIL